MIGKAHTNRSYKATILYLFQESKGGEVITAFGIDEIMEDMVWQLEEVGKLHGRSKNKLIHAHFSLTPGEHLENSQWESITKDYIEKLGAKNNQYIAVLHKDKEYEHIHILVNRISFDGNLLSDSFSSNKASKLADEKEKEFDLIVAKEKGNILKDEIRQIIDKSIEQSPLTLSELWSKIRLNEWEVSIFENGVSFIKKGKSFVKFKGSSLGKAYSFKSLKKRVEVQLAKVLGGGKLDNKPVALRTKEELIVDIKTIIENALKSKPKDLDSLWREVEKSSWTVVLNGKRGVSFRYDNGLQQEQFKGSEVSRKYTLGGIKKTISLIQQELGR